MENSSDKHRRIVRQRKIMAACVLIFLGALLVAGIIYIPKAVDAIKEEIDEMTAAPPEAEEPKVEEAEAPKIEEPREEPDVDELMDRAEEVISSDEAGEADREILEKISVMTNAQRIAQLFFLAPETLTGVDAVTAAGEATMNALSENQVGGLIYFEKNIVDPKQLREMLDNTAKFALSANNIPIFLGIDEEGGKVSRIGQNEAFKGEIPQDISLQLSGGLSPEGVYTVAGNIGSYLKDFGFNVDFAPVADIALSENSAMTGRSFGNEADYVSEMAVNFAQGLEDKGIVACYKHFPGMGRASENTDTEVVSINAVTEELKGIDARPFVLGIENGAEMIMMSNASYPDADASGVPAAMSKTIVTDYLKNELGFKGIVITDALNAKSITGRYSSGEAAIAAFNAGCDMLLMPEDYEEAYNAMLTAYESGQIDNERLNDALVRILTVKKRLAGQTGNTGADTGADNTTDAGAKEEEQ